MGVPGIFSAAGVETSSSSKPRSGTIVVVVWAWTVRENSRTGVLRPGVTGNVDALGDRVLVEPGVDENSLTNPLPWTETLFDVCDWNGDRATARIGE